MMARLEPKCVKGKTPCRPIQEELNDNPYYITNQKTYNDGWGTNAKFVCTGENGYRYDIDLHWVLDRYIFEITSPWRKILYYITEEDFNNARNAFHE